MLSDQSLFVSSAIEGVVREGIIAATLTGLMILLFLGSWRSTLIIAVSIPLSVLASILTLSMLGQTINIMTLGGLALAVGILVDDATVAVENINAHLESARKWNRHPRRRAPDRHSRARFYFMYLYRVRADVLSDRRGEVPVHSAG